MSFQQKIEAPPKEETPEVVTHRRGQKSFQPPSYTKKRGKIQPLSWKGDAEPIGVVPETLGKPRLEFAIARHDGIKQFRVTQVFANGQRNRIYLHPGHLLALVNYSHQGRTRLGAVQ